MDRTLQRSLIGSTAAHGGLLILVVVLSTLAARRIIQPEIPVLELIPTNLKLTMGNQIGGGTPNPRPLAKTEGTPPPAPIPQPPPTQVQPTPPKVAEKVVEKPVQPPKAAEKVEPTPDEPVKPAVSKVKVTTEIKTVAKAQDVDLTKKADKPAAATPPKVQVNTKKLTRSSDDKRAEREAQEAEEAARAEHAERAERQAAARSFAARLTGAASSVSKNVGGSTEIEMPGPGGAAYAPYLSWLQRYVEQQWRKPATTSQAAEVTLDLEIARDGRVLRAEISRSSGIPELDRSAKDVFRRNPKLQPLPADYKEATLSVPVKFVLTP